MADTTKNAVLSLARELTIFVRNIRQEAVLTVVSAEDSTAYTVTIDTVDYTITSGASATVEDIAAALKVEIDNATLSLVITDNVDGTLTIISSDAAIRFDIDADLDANISVEITVVQHLGEDLFDMILADVALEVTEERYRTEEERAQRYLAAHLLTLLRKFEFSSDSIGDVIRDKVGDVETWYSDSAINTDMSSDIGLRTTPYGRTYMSIRSRHSVCFI